MRRTNRRHFIGRGAAVAAGVAAANLLVIAGVGAHVEGDIKAHTTHVLDEIQQQLESAGSSMEKILKCNV